MSWSTIDDYKPERCRHRHIGGRVRVLLVHNFYLQPGGEDRVFAEEADLLESRGHAVQRWTTTNRSLVNLGLLAAARATIWNPAAASEVSAIVRSYRPDVVHFHNTFPLISPAAYYAVRKAGIPVIQTLHNYRLVCPAATLYRSGKPCEDCVGRRVAWPAVAHKCYRGSRGASAVVASMLAVHWAAKTWQQQVTRFIALTNFQRSLMLRAGLPAKQVIVKPNFLARDPGHGAHQESFALYVGRLVPEKGLATLLKAWASLPRDCQLKIVGDGALKNSIDTRSEQIEWLGRLSEQDVGSLMRRARFLVVPSEWYEGFPMTLVEAFAAGLPVVASNIGSIRELVLENGAGVLFEYGNVEDLAATLEWAFAHRDDMSALGQAGRAAFENKFSAAQAYANILDIYSAARAESAGNAAINPT